MRRLAVPILAMVLATAACAPEPVTEEEEGGIQLVTEDELILHAAQEASNQIALLVAAMFSGGDPPIKVCSVESNSWNHDKTITNFVLFYPIDFDCGKGNPGWAGELTIHTTFSAGRYEDGTVDEHSCHKLPGAGTQTTGEADELTNDTGAAIERTVNHTTEESSSESNSLSETLDLTNGQTIEAGGGVPGVGEGKATVTFEQHFGIEHGSTKDHSKSKSVTIEDAFVVDAGHIVSAIYTLDDSTIRCDLRISSNLNWGLSIRVWRHDCEGNCGNTDILVEHGVISSHGRNVHLSFDSIDDLVRLSLGHDTSCDRCDFNLGRHGRWAVSALSDPANHGRHIAIDGTREKTIKDSASVIFRDVSNKDHDCVDKVSSRQGVSVADLDDKLADC